MGRFGRGERRGGEDKAGQGNEAVGHVGLQAGGYVRCSSGPSSQLRTGSSTQSQSTPDRLARSSSCPCRLPPPAAPQQAPAEGWSICPLLLWYREILNWCTVNFRCPRLRPDRLEHLTHNRMAGPKTGRHRRLPRIRTPWRTFACFNPRPARRPAATARATPARRPTFQSTAGPKPAATPASTLAAAASCFNPRPARRPAATQDGRGDDTVARFNPRPARRPAATDY